MQESNNNQDSNNNQANFCRVCRSTSFDNSPLYYPCLCKGSIKHIHQECLEQQMRHSNYSKCEICGYSFRFSNLLVANAPSSESALSVMTVWRQVARNLIQPFLLHTGRLSMVLMSFFGLLPLLTSFLWFTLIPKIDLAILNKQIIAMLNFIQSLYQLVWKSKNFSIKNRSEVLSKFLILFGDTFTYQCYGFFICTSIFVLTCLFVLICEYLRLFNGQATRNRLTNHNLNHNPRPTDARELVNEDVAEDSDSAISNQEAQVSEDDIWIEIRQLFQAFGFTGPLNLFLKNFLSMASYNCVLILVFVVLPRFQGKLIHFFCVYVRQKFDILTATTPTIPIHQHFLSHYINLNTNFKSSNPIQFRYYNTTNTYQQNICKVHDLIFANLDENTYQDFFRDQLLGYAFTLTLTLTYLVYKNFWKIFGDCNKKIDLIRLGFVYTVNFLRKALTQIKITCFLFIGFSFFPLLIGFVLSLLTVDIRKTNFSNEIASLKALQSFQAPYIEHCTLLFNQWLFGFVFCLSNAYLSNKLSKIIRSKLFASFLSLRFGRPQQHPELLQNPEPQRNFLVNQNNTQDDESDDYEERNVDEEENELEENEIRFLKGLKNLTIAKFIIRIFFSLILYSLIAFFIVHLPSKIIAKTFNGIVPIILHLPNPWDIPIDFFIVDYMVLFLIRFFFNNRWFVDTLVEFQIEKIGKTLFRLNFSQNNTLRNDRLGLRRYIDEEDEDSDDEPVFNQEIHQRSTEHNFKPASFRFLRLVLFLILSQIAYFALILIGFIFPLHIGRTFSRYFRPNLLKHDSICLMIGQYIYRIVQYLLESTFRNFLTKNSYLRITAKRIFSNNPNTNINSVSNNNEANFTPISQFLNLFNRFQLKFCSPIYRIVLKTLVLIFICSRLIFNFLLSTVLLIGFLPLLIGYMVIILFFLPIVPNILRNRLPSVIISSSPTHTFKRDDFPPGVGLNFYRYLDWKIGMMILIQFFMNYKRGRLLMDAAGINNRINVQQPFLRRFFFLLYFDDIFDKLINDGFLRLDIRFVLVKIIQPQCKFAFYHFFLPLTLYSFLFSGLKYADQMNLGANLIYKNFEYKNTNFNGVIITLNNRSLSHDMCPASYNKNPETHVPQSKFNKDLIQYKKSMKSSSKKGVLTSDISSKKQVFEKVDIQEEKKQGKIDDNGKFYYHPVFFPGHNKSQTISIAYDYMKQVAAISKLSFFNFYQRTYQFLKIYNFEFGSSKKVSILQSNTAKIEIWSRLLNRLHRFYHLMYFYLALQRFVSWLFWNYLLVYYWRLKRYVFAQQYVIGKRLINAVSSNNSNADNIDTKNLKQNDQN